MTRALFQLFFHEERNQQIRLARGTVEDGPAELLEWSLDGMLTQGRQTFEQGLTSAGQPIRPGWRISPPIDHQEVWAAGVTYARSRDARMDESAEPSIYDRVYDADRPELFFKSPSYRVRGPGETVGIRADSAWNVPEPELAVVFSADGSVVGYTIGNDMSSRSIEGDNPLYLPQAKTYQHACALGPAIVPASEVAFPLEIGLEIERAGQVVARESTSTAKLKRSVEELGRHLFRALDFPIGVVLLTGTGAVPPPEFTLQEGDLIRIEIQGLGRLENPVAVVGGS